MMRIWSIVCFVVITACIFACNPGGARPPAATGSSTSGGGTTTVNRAVQTMTAAEFTTWLNGQRGKWVLVDYWATWCAPCKEKIPRVVELDKRYRDRGLIVVALSFDEPDEHAQVAAFLAEHSAQFPAMVRSEKMGDAFEGHKISEVPTYRLFNPEGELATQFVGEFDFDELERLVSSTLALDSR